MPDLDVWWGCRQAANHLGIHQETCRRACAAGDVAGALKGPRKIGWRAPARCWQRWWYVNLAVSDDADREAGRPSVATSSDK